MGTIRSIGETVALGAIMVISVVIAAMEKVVYRTNLLVSKLEQRRVRRNNTVTQHKYGREGGMRRRVGTKDVIASGSKTLQDEVDTEEMPIKAETGVGRKDVTALGNKTVQEEMDIMVDTLQFQS